MLKNLVKFIKPFILLDHVLGNAQGIVSAGGVGRPDDKPWFILTRELDELISVEFRGRVNKKKVDNFDVNTGWVGNIRVLKSDADYDKCLTFMATLDDFVECFKLTDKDFILMFVKNLALENNSFEHEGFLLISRYNSVVISSNENDGNYIGFEYSSVFENGTLRSNDTYVSREGQVSWLTNLDTLAVKVFTDWIFRVNKYVRNLSTCVSNCNSKEEALSAFKFEGKLRIAPEDRDNYSCIIESLQLVDPECDIKLVKDAIEKTTWQIYYQNKPMTNIQLFKILKEKH